MLNQQKIFNSKILIILIGIIISIFIWQERWLGSNSKGWTRIVDCDGRGYYAYLPAVFIYQDLNFDFIKRAEAEVYGAESADYLVLMSGQRGDKYFIGTALLISPFFLLAWLLSYILGYSLTGYNQIFFEAVSFAALFYFLSALIFIRKFLGLYKIKDFWICVILIMTVFGTNAFHYVVYEQSMSHVYSFFAVSAFIYYLKRYQYEGKLYQVLLTAVSLAIIGLIRPVNGFIIFAIPFLLGSFNELKIFISFYFSKIKHLILSIVVFSAIIFLEPLVLYFSFGDFFRWPYRDETFYFFSGHYWDALISYRKGLFLYTPFIFLAVFSSLFFIRKSFYWAASFIIFFLFLNLIISSWGYWSYGGCYSLRAYLEYYPLFIIPLSTGLNELKNIKSIISVLSLLFLLLVVSIIQTWQYENKMIHYDAMDKEKYWKVFLSTDRRSRLHIYPQSVYTLDEDSIKNRKVILNTFEGEIDWGASGSIFPDDYYSPKHSVRIDRLNIYSPPYKEIGQTFINENISFVHVKLMAKVMDRRSDAKFAMSLDYGNGQSYKYEGYEITLAVDKLREWTPLTFNLRLPELKPDNKLTIFAWNNSYWPVFIDDMQVELYELK